MSVLFTLLGLVMVASSESDNARTIGAVLAGAGLNDVLREHKDTKGAA